MNNSIMKKSSIDNRIFIKDVRWAEPRKESYFTNLDELYYNYQTYKSNAIETSKRIKEQYSRDSIIEIYENRFRDVLK